MIKPTTPPPNPFLAFPIPPISQKKLLEKIILKWDPPLLKGRIDRKLKYSFCIYGCGVSLAKVLISKVNNTNQKCICLNCSSRPNGLFKPMRFVKIPAKGIVSNELWCDTFKVHTSLMLNPHQDKHQICLDCSSYVLKTVWSSVGITISNNFLPMFVKEKQPKAFHVFLTRFVFFRVGPEHISDLMGL